MPDTVGKTSRLAIQLRLGVAYNEVAISPETHRIAGGYFECLSLCAQSLHGMALPVEIFRVLRESGARSRLDAAVQLTPLIGRKAEVARLIGLWKKAAQGKRQVVLVQGEAGIGKSRLLLTMKERLTDQPHVIRELRCFPEFSQSPFYPLIEMLEGIFSFSHSDAPEVKSGKLAQYLENHYPAMAPEAVPLLSTLLSLPLAAQYKTPAVSPQKQKEQTVAILLDLLQALAAGRPVLLIVEDLHWVDPSTLGLLTSFVERKESGPVLALFTARPEFVPPWKGAAKSTLALAPLVEDAAIKMAASINWLIPPATLHCIVERADGVPLFVEEMVKMATLDNQAGIPATLHDLLTARMDKLGKAKSTAQLAATIGREFDLDLLHKVFPQHSATLTHCLSVLQDAGLILQVSETTRQFKHALIQEAAYQSQARADRQVAHNRIAQTLLSDFPDVVATRPEVVAQHFSAGGEAQKSIEYWIRAGQRATSSSANMEAAEHFNSASQLLTSLPASPDRDKTEFTILTHLCPVLYATKGYGSEEATRANARISALSGLVGDSHESFLAEWAQVMNTIAGVGSRDVPQAAMRLFNMTHGDPLRMQAVHYAVADAAFWLGNFETARMHTEQSLALYHPDQHRMLLERYNENLSVSCAAYLAWSLYFLGYPERAQQVGAQMLQQARELEHPHTLALALCFASLINRWTNKRAETLVSAAETIAVSRQQDFSVWLAAGEMTHGWALAMHGQKEEGIAELKSSIAGMQAAIGGISVVFLSALIEAYVHLEMYGEALTLIAETQAEVARTGDGHFTAELHRLEGVCLLEISASNAAEAEACFERALAISRRQHAKSLELRAAMSLVRLWQRQGRREDARCLLQEIYNRFTEGMDTPDIQEARELLGAPWLFDNRFRR